MVKTVKFVYALILFLFLSFIAKNVDGNLLFSSISNSLL